MPHPFKRLRRLWALSGSEFQFVPEEGAEQLAPGTPIPGTMQRISNKPIGDGKAVFLSDMSEDEYQTHVQENERGWKPFFDRVLGRNRSSL